MHGTIETPVFMNVGTSAAIKCGTYEDLRIENMNEIKKVECDGYVIGALPLARRRKLCII